MQRAVGVADAARVGHPGPDDDLRAGWAADGRCPPARARPCVSVETALVELLAAAVRIATPLFFAALGGILSERAGCLRGGPRGHDARRRLRRRARRPTSPAAPPAGPRRPAFAAGALLALLVAVATVRVRRRPEMVDGPGPSTSWPSAPHELPAARPCRRGRRGGDPGAWPVCWPRGRCRDWPDVPVLGRRCSFRQPPLTYAAVVFGVLVARVPRRATARRDSRCARSARTRPRRSRSASTPGRRSPGGGVLACRRAGGPGPVAVLSLQQVGTFTERDDERPRLYRAGRDHRRALAARLPRCSACLLFGGRRPRSSWRVQSLRLPVSSYVIQMMPYVVAPRRARGAGPLGAACRPRSARPFHRE